MISISTKNLANHKLFDNSRFYDMMKNTLEANKTDDSLPRSLQQAANAGHTLLMKYYSLHATITSM